MFANEHNCFKLHRLGYSPVTTTYIVKTRVGVALVTNPQPKYFWVWSLKWVQLNLSARHQQLNTGLLTWWINEKSSRDQRRLFCFMNRSTVSQKPTGWR